MGRSEREGRRRKEEGRAQLGPMKKAATLALQPRSLNFGPLGRRRHV